MKLYRSCIVVFGVLSLTQSVRAQVPFFFRGATAFTPEISVVSTGVLLDMQATVSADRKYVTLNARPQASTLLALRSFNFQQGGVGFGNVGDPPPANNNAVGGKSGAGNATSSSAVRTSPSDILAHAKSDASVLHHEGMSRISSLKD
jgi:hypothetical protein